MKSQYITRFLFYFLLAMPLLSFGQEEKKKDTVTVDLSTPRKTVKTHLKYLQDDNYHPNASARSFNPKYPLKERKNFARELKEIWDGQGIRIYTAQISNNPNYTDSASSEHMYILDQGVEGISLEKVGDRWYYSDETVRHIDELHKETYPFGTHKLLNILPNTTNKKYLGLYLWQIIGLAILILVAVIIHNLFTFLLRKVITVILLKAGYKDIAKGFVKPIASPAAWFIVVFLMSVFIRVLQLPIEFAHYTIIILKSLVPLFATIIVYRLVDIVSLYMHRMAEKTQSTLDDQLVPLVSKTLKIFVVLIGVIFILSSLDINVIPILTGLSIGGLAFALAAQDTLKNFFGSIMIFLDRPFQIGDWITAGSDIDGTIEEVGFRSTRIRTFRNSVTSVPNGKLADMTVDNHGLRVYRRFYTRLAITYDTPPDVIEAFVEGLRKLTEDHPDTRKDNYHIYLNEFGGSALEIMYYVFFRVPDWGGELKARHELMLQIIELSEDLGVRFAFPTQTLHMETFPEKESLTPEYTDSPDQLKEKLAAFYSKKGLN
ncbi:mechanosensitive ion channel family protein [Mangrovivirga sp. M17]|uniref:Mechanosensitive ion channel family protein n=1 Tax=Mangrovivirga halotolerans TaxID=2993936 RepID=A0ABT3RPV4_9BACT|nr:mechanosensitive ion channel family protein [Mangrovivirga halotolerans]MCX2743622.1 mechanosensitive ion channel family protein [Mangrovivirga halotolerans]